MVIMQRVYVCEHIKPRDFENLDLDRIKSIFDSSNLYEVRADLDSFEILAQIA